MFSSKSFIVSGFMFRFLIHFEFIFVYGVRKCFNFILLCRGFPGGSDGKELPAIQETWIQSLDWEYLLEKDEGIPWTEEPGRLQSVELQRVGHN